jgi:3-deoxy-D-manno-octulosonic-acid transferase
MLTFLYNFIWTLAVLIFLPFLSFFRKARISGRLRPDLHLAPSEKKRMWIHALSVGEVISAVPLIRAIKARHPSLSIVFTVKTAQGMEVAKKELPDKAAFLLPMPLDFWWSYSRMFRRINPAIFLYIEGDVWPGLLSYIYKKGVKVFLVNGRISPRTFRSYRRFSPVVRSLLNKFELCLMQSEIDRDRLVDIGLSPQKVKDTGNIKFDRPWRTMEKDEHDQWLNKLNLQPEKILWVAGSTHEGEDRIILETYKRLQDNFPNLFLIIAPRRIEAAEDSFKLSLDMGFNTALRSSLTFSKSFNYDVLILDTIGELDRIYGLAHISFVGGSMVPVGGHNLLEPASFGCPVLFGVHTHNFQLMSEGLLESGGGLRVKDGEDLFLKIKALLSDNKLLIAMGAKARGFVLKNSGAVDRIIEHIGGYINQNA